MSHETEKLEVCPYNPAHTILRYRMQTHLHRCRLQHRDLDWGYCSHNNTHHMPRLEIEYHERHLCPDRHSFQSMVYNFASDQQSLAPVVHIELPESEENWDDGQVNYFDPKKNAQEKCIIRGVHCVPPSERKKFKLEHRRQLQERNEGMDGGIKAKVKTQPMPQKEQVGVLEPLRPPKELPKGLSFARGSKIRSDSVRSPGMVNDLAKLSLNSNKEEAHEVVSQTERVDWSGLGRGSPVEKDSPSLPLNNAWGRGRPRF